MKMWKKQHRRNEELKMKVIMWLLLLLICIDSSSCSRSVQVFKFCDLYATHRSSFANNLCSNETVFLFDLEINGPRDEIGIVPISVPSITVIDIEEKWVLLSNLLVRYRYFSTSTLPRWYRFRILSFFIKNFHLFWFNFIRLNEDQLL